MWHEHFCKLYDSANDVHSKNLFYERLAKCVSDTNGMVNIFNLLYT